MATKTTVTRKAAKRRTVPKQTAARKAAKRRTVPKQTAARKAGTGAGGASGGGGMVEIGDRVVVEAERVGREPRAGVVSHVVGAMIRVRWDDGNESSFVPASGSLQIVGRAGARVSKRP